MYSLPLLVPRSIGFVALKPKKSNAPENVLRSAKERAGWRRRESRIRRQTVHRKAGSSQLVIVVIYEEIRGR
jgi:hypothetical protein